MAIHHQVCPQLERKTPAAILSEKRTVRLDSEHRTCQIAPPVQTQNKLVETKEDQNRENCRLDFHCEHFTAKNPAYGSRLALTSRIQSQSMNLGGRPLRSYKPCNSGYFEEWPRLEFRQVNAAQRSGY